ATRVRTFTGTYTLVGSRLSIFFTMAHSNDPDDAVRSPSATKEVEISIGRNTLIFTESDGRRFYNWLQ
ncbi:MAG: hypothetical protein VCE12_06095, partial [Candidatus Latescibacterota bacterium]